MRIEETCTPNSVKFGYDLTSLCVFLACVVQVRIDGLNRIPEQQQEANDHVESLIPLALEPQVHKYTNACYAKTYASDLMAPVKDPLNSFVCFELLIQSCSASFRTI